MMTRVSKFWTTLIGWLFEIFLGFYLLYCFNFLVRQVVPQPWSFLPATALLATFLAFSRRFHLMQKISETVRYHILRLQNNSGVIGAKKAPSGFTEEKSAAGGCYRNISMAGKLSAGRQFLYLFLLPLALRLLVIFLLPVPLDGDIGVYCGISAQLASTGQVVEYAGYSLAFPYLFWQAVFLLPASMVSASYLSYEIYLAVLLSAAGVILYHALRIIAGEEHEVFCRLAAMLYGYLPFQVMACLTPTHEVSFTILLPLFLLCMGKGLCDHSSTDFTESHEDLTESSKDFAESPKNFMDSGLSGTAVGQKSGMGSPATQSKVEPAALQQTMAGRWTKPAKRIAWILSGTAVLCMMGLFNNMGIILLIAFVLTLLFVMYPSAMTTEQGSSGHLSGSASFSEARSGWQSGSARQSGRQTLLRSPGFYTSITILCVVLFIGVKHFSSYVQQPFYQQYTEMEAGNNAADGSYAGLARPEGMKYVWRNIYAGGNYGTQGRFTDPNDGKVSASHTTDEMRVLALERWGAIARNPLRLILHLLNKSANTWSGSHYAIEYAAVFRQDRIVRLLLHLLVVVNDLFYILMLHEVLHYQTKNLKKRTVRGCESNLSPDRVLCLLLETYLLGCAAVLLPVEAMNKYSSTAFAAILILAAAAVGDDTMQREAEGS